jgi:DNA gyrase inhibitor GyrI
LDRISTVSHAVKIQTIYGEKVTEMNLTTNYSEIKIETLPLMTVGGYAAISVEPEGESTRFVQAWVAKKNLLDASVRIFGFDVEVPSEASQEGKRGYETWMTVPAGTASSDGVVVKEFPGGLYATMTLFKPFDKPFETIPSGWHFLHDWVIHHEQYQGGHHQWLEELLTTSEGNDLKLYHPIALR